MLAQAEHDVNACVVVVTLDDATASSISSAIEQLIPDAPRADVIRASLDQRGAILIAGSIAEAVDFANEFAPEHLLLGLREAGSGKRERTNGYGQRDVLASIRNAGCVFIGESSSVVFGDYITGGNHVLPTGGLARSLSGLGTLDFVRWTSYQKVTRAAAQKLAADTHILANAEGLPAHAAAALGWSDQC